MLDENTRQDDVAVPAPGHSVLSLRRVSKWVGGHRILHDVSLEVPAGKVTAVIGPSAAGKTTLLKCMNLLSLIDEGEVLFCGKPVISAHRVQRHPIDALLRRIMVDASSDVPVQRELFVAPSQYRQAVAMIFQEFNLWPDRTVLENLLEGPVYAKGEVPKIAKMRAVDVLKRVSLPNVLYRLPHELSGGQRQRVAIARALMMNAKVILADEITSALDPELVGEVNDTVRRLASEGTSMVLVTHQLEFASKVADQVAMLYDGEIIEVGPPGEVLVTPKHELTARFIRRLKAAV